jgi:predicted DNA-binding protein
MKIFVSQASHNAAHNLDDLSQRWELRKEGQGYEFTLPEALPAIRNLVEAKRYKAELYKVLCNLQQEIKRCKRNSEREAIQAQIHHVSGLQMALKVVTHKLGQQEDSNKHKWIPADVPKDEKAQMRRFGYLVRIGEARLLQDENGFLVTFPKQNITVRVAVENES